MATRKIDKVDWASYFDQATRQIIDGKGPQQAEIRILGPEAGAQIETEWQPLLGITYDHKDNLLEVAVEHHDHLISHPDDIYVQEGEDGALRGLEVIEGDTKHIVELR